MNNKKPDKKEIENKLNLVIDKLMNLGRPDNDEELEKGGESIGFFKRDFGIKEWDWPQATIIRRSKRPGRSSAGSRISLRLVAAITITPVLAPKPSISTSNWFRVCSLSSCPPPRPAPL